MIGTEIQNCHSELVSESYNFQIEIKENLKQVQVDEL